MASGMVQDQGTVPENLKKKLALAVRSIQWSYGIFWSISVTQPGVLEWGEGYYNGDIKTRKTIQSVELNADQMGLQRSEQLRELYESLSAGESSPQIRRPSAALSPEDLTDTEWYYLVCMSFIFDIGQGLPGRTLASGQPIWLCNAHYADSKIFSRSLLAKSASMQAVVCFPFRGGVIELGVTEMVKEDPSLIRHVKTSFLEVPFPKASGKYEAALRHRSSDEDLACNALDNEMNEIKMISLVGEPEMTSPDTSSNDFEPNQLPEDSFMVEGMNGVASQVQSWQFMDEEFSNCVHHSVNSSDCISQTFVEPGKSAGTEKEKFNNVSHQPIFQECDQAKMIENGREDLHYQNVLSFLLKSSHPLVLGPHFQRGKQESSFVAWKKGGFPSCHMPPSGTPQKLLKRILFVVPRMHEGGFTSPVDNGKKDEVWRPEADDISANHALLERRRRGKINERFSLLKSIIPCIEKVDKVSILDETIEYLRGLEMRVADLESHRESLQQDVKSKRKFQDAVERTSDNYNDNKMASGKRMHIKRKTCDDGTEDEIDRIVVQKNSSIENLTVSMDENNVLVKMKCSWRDGVLLEIINALSNLHLDSYSVQSSTSNGILSLKIKSKFRGLTISSAPTIEEELRRVL